MKIRSTLSTILLLLMLTNLTVAADMTTVQAPAQAQAPAPGAIIGQIVTDDGQPFPGGVVSFFSVANGLPIDKGVVRRIPENVVRSGKEGMFRADLPADTYYIGALMRDIGRGPGPPRAGETFLFVLKDKNTLQTFTVKSGESLVAGSLTGGMPEISIDPAQEFTAQGMVTYENGQPFAGALVTVKKDVASLRPLYISKPTSDDGTFSIQIPAGEYYFIALESIQGGRPARDSHLGGYGGGSPVKAPEEKPVIYQPLETGMKDTYVDGLVVSGKAGDILKGINITMYTMPDPEKIRQERRDQTKALEEPAPK